MCGLLRGPMWGLLVLGVGLAAGASPAARADALSAVQVLREGGCGGVVPRALPLRHEAQLDRAAERWAHGATLRSAAASYPPLSVAGLHLHGPESSLLQLLRHSSCHEVTDQSLQAIGAYRVGLETWIVLYPARAPSQLQAQIEPTPPAPAQASAHPSWAARAQTQPPVAIPLKAAPAAGALAPRALQLVNEVRERGARCGNRSFAPAKPVTLSQTLTGVASAHALDMAQHNYFEHVDLAGQSPADRVRSVGYREKLVGENIAYGPETVDEVVQGWLDSPGHCENIMDPRFAQMGIAVAPGRSGRRGLYWVQVLAEPRA